MKWGSPELFEFAEKMDGKINDEMKLLMLGLHHIDARIGHLHAIGYYACAALTGILVILWMR